MFKAFKKIDEKIDEFIDILEATFSSSTKQNSSKKDQTEEEAKLWTDIEEIFNDCFAKTKARGERAKAAYKKHKPVVVDAAIDGAIIAVDVVIATVGSKGKSKGRAAGGGGTAKAMAIMSVIVFVATIVKKWLLKIKQDRKRGPSQAGYAV